MLSPLSVPMTSERDGFRVSTQMAGSSESFSTAAVTTAGRSVSADCDVALDRAVAGGDSPDRQPINRRPRTVQAVSEEGCTDVKRGDDRRHRADAAYRDIIRRSREQLATVSSRLCIPSLRDRLSPTRHTRTFLG